MFCICIQLFLDRYILGRAHYGQYFPGISQIFWVRVRLKNIATHIGSRQSAALVKSWSIDKDHCGWLAGWPVWIWLLRRRITIHALHYHPDFPFLLEKPNKCPRQCGIPRDKIWFPVYMSRNKIGQNKGVAKCFVRVHLIRLLQLEGPSRLYLWRPSGSSANNPLLLLKLCRPEEEGGTDSAHSCSCAVAVNKNALHLSHQTSVRNVSRVALSAPTIPFRLRNVVYS